MIAFTGDSQFVLSGVEIDREWAIALARKAGMHVHPRVTKKVQLLVDCDAGGESGNELKALEYGIAVATESEFWAALGLPVERKQWRPADRIPRR
jgi:NAD-dependent DNA ligase